MSEKRYTKREGFKISSIPLTYKHAIPVSKTEKFWKGLAEGKIYATRCKICGSLYFPPQVDCANCRSADVEWVEVPEEGVPVTFTKVYARPQGYEGFDPYIIAIVEAGDVRVMGWVMNINDETKLKIGSKVKIQPVYIEKHDKYIIGFYV